MRVAILIAVLGAALITPGSETHGAAGQKRDAVAAALALEGQMSGIRVQRTLVVRDSKGFAALWKQHTGNSAPPVVDFKKYDVVAIFAGEKRTGGHGVRIDSVKRTERSATVTATLLSPAPNMMVTQMLTYPWAMRAEPKLPPTVKFDLRKGNRVIGRPSRIISYQLSVINYQLSIINGLPK